MVITDPRRLLPASRRKLVLETDLETDDHLSEDEIEFVRIYLSTRNASEAGRAIGLKYPGPGGSKWLQKKKIQRAIQIALKANHISKDHVFTELSDLAYIDVAQFLNDDGTINMYQVRANKGKIKKYKCKLVKTERGDEVTERVYDVELELHDRYAALVDIGKTFKMFGNEQTDVISKLIELLVTNAKAELPEEMAGRFLSRVSSDLIKLRN